MLQDRLNDLATCCIEKDILENIDLILHLEMREEAFWRSIQA
jgi:hypothetical protein